MKKIAIFAFICTLMLSTAACQSGKSKKDKEKDSTENVKDSADNTDEEDAVYEDEAIEVIESNVIDPYDDAAYEKYAVQDYEEETVTEPEYSETTNTANANTGGKTADAKKYDKLMDQFDAKAEKMQRLAQQGKQYEAAMLSLEITKLMEEITYGYSVMSPAQRRRHDKQVESFSMLLQNYL